jgi:hypothetical protein
MNLESVSRKEKGRDNRKAWRIGCQAIKWFDSIALDNTCFSCLFDLKRGFLWSGPCWLVAWRLRKRKQAEGENAPNLSVPALISDKSPSEGVSELGRGHFER